MLKQMDPVEVRKLLEGHEDVISQEVAKDERFFSNLTCPVCSGMNCSKRAKAVTPVQMEDGSTVMTPFRPGKVVQEGNGYCNDCGTEFDPYTNVVASTQASMIAEPG